MDGQRRSGPTVLSNPEGGELIVVLDTGGVDALVPADERGRARLRALRQRADDLVVPAAVLAEGLLTGHPGRDHHLRRLLAGLAIASVDEGLGLAAGSLRTRVIRDRTAPPPSGVDAIVAATADDRAASQDVAIVTGDVDDLTALATYGRHAARIAITAA